MPTRSVLAAAALGATAVATIPSVVFASTYVVRPGDTASDIAVRHGTTVAALLDANRMAAPELIRVGQMLQIPDASLTLPEYARGSHDAETYRVGKGEGVFETARRFGVDPTALARTNGIGVNAPIAEGDELVVPGRLTRMNALVSFVAADVGVDVRLVRGVAWAESQWNQERVSPTGAVGVMQLEPFTGEWVSRHLAGGHLDILAGQGQRHGRFDAAAPPDDEAPGRHRRLARRVLPGRCERGEPRHLRRHAPVSARSAGADRSGRLSAGERPAANTGHRAAPVDEARRKS
jgi:LysM repeat protein